MTMVFQKVGDQDAALQYLKSTEEGFEPCDEAEAEIIKLTFVESGETMWLEVTDDEPEDPRDVPDLPGQQDPDLIEQG